MEQCEPLAAVIPDELWSAHEARIDLLMPDSDPLSRRHHGQWCRLVELCAVLHQHQRPRGIRNGEPAVVAVAEDMTAALDLMAIILAPATLITDRRRLILDAHAELSAQAAGGAVPRADIASRLKIDHRSLRRDFLALEEARLLRRHPVLSNGRQVVYLAEVPLRQNVTGGSAS